MEKLYNKDTKTQVLETMNRIYRAGLTTTSGGNISGIDESGHIFITPSGIDKGSLTPPDIAEVLPDGKRLGRYAPSMELPFHSNIYRLRKDIKGIVHAHAPAVVAYATAHKTPNASVARCYSDLLGNISSSRYDIPGSLGLGEIVKAEFEKGYSSVMMDNHGATVGAASLTQAYLMYEGLEFLSETLIGAAALGNVKLPETPVQTVIREYETFSPKESETLSSAKREMLGFLKRSYRNKLVSGAFGTFAAKLPDGSVLFNPDSADRGTIDETDLAVYRNGKCSSKTASVYLPLILKLFEVHPEANAVFVSMPSATMSFAVTGTPLDSKLIPESYIMLKNVLTLPYGSVLNDLDAVSKALTTKTPVAIADNECAITIGRNMTKAFDRMEVLDYSARSILKAKSIAKIVPISEREVEDIDRTFNGW